MRLADAFDAEIRRTWSTHAAQALVAALALTAAALLGGSLAWMLACALVGLLFFGVLGVAARRRFLRGVRESALAPGAIVAFAHERGILTLWLRNGEAVELRSALADVGSARRAGPEERARLAAHGRAARLVADLERELAVDTLIGELAREHFASWAAAWRARSPFELDPEPIEKLLHELYVQVLAARDYEKVVGQRGMVANRDFRDIPFVSKVAELQGRLAAALGQGSGQV